MGTLSGLVKTIAVVQGLDENQVLWIARYLREAGLISQGGRGRGGAKMTISDAVNLLIGVNAPGAPKDAPTLVRTFRELRLTRDHLASQDPDEWDDSSEEPFRRGSPFGPAFESIVSGLVGREMSGLSDDVTSITLSGPSPTAKIYSGYADPEKASDVGLSVEFGRDESDDRNLPDQYVSKTFTDRTLMAVGQVLAT
jgi:hypothetical protein